METWMWVVACVLSGGLSAGIVTGCWMNSVESTSKQNRVLKEKLKKRKRQLLKALVRAEKQ